MSEGAYAVAAEFMLETNVPKVLRELIEGFERLEGALSKAQEQADRFGKAGAEISRMVRSLGKLKEMEFPSSLVEGAHKLESGLGGATVKMDEFAARAKEAAGAFKEMHVGRIEGGARDVASGGHGGGRGHGGDPVMEGIGGGAILEFLLDNYKENAKLDQTYRKMQDDKRLTDPVMERIRGNAAGQSEKYPGLLQEDIAKNAGEGYTLSGGNINEQSGIADMLDRIENTLVFRGKSPEDAQAQATAIARAMDISNQYYDKKTGEFSQTKADDSANRVLGIVAASNGLVKGQNILAFEKSAGRMGQNLSLEGESKLAHFIDVNPSKAATALNSFMSLFSNGGTALKDKNFDFFEERGVFSYDKKAKKWVTNDADLLKSDPVEFIMKRLKGISDDDLASHAQRMNVAANSLETRGSIGNIRRQANTIGFIDTAANDKKLENSSQGKLIEFSASMDRFRITMGNFEQGPGIKILDSLTSGIDRLTKLMNAHPDFTDGFLKLTAAVAAFAVVRGVASLLGLGEGIGLLGKGLAMFMRGAAGATALETLGATAGAGSLFGLAGGIVALGAALLGLPPLLKFLAGDPAQNPHPNTNARGQPYSGRTAADAPKAPPTKGFSDFLRETWEQSKHPQSTNARGLGNIHRESYQTPLDGGMIHWQPIHVSVMMPDGRVLADVVTKHQAREDRQASRQGMNDPDHRETPFPAGLRSA